MAFDRAKILAEGGTYHGNDNPLIECSTFKADNISWEAVSVSGLAPSSIKEDANLPKRMVIEGVFQRFMPESIPAASEAVKNYRNANKRVYTMERVGRKVFDPNGEVQKRINERGMIGHLEHPEKGTTDLNCGAILVTKVWVEEDGTVKGRAIVYNTPEGQRIQEYVLTGTKIGISSRGTGTVDANGFVCEDFQLETWDIVYNPSTFGAHPTVATESVLREPPVHAQPVLETSLPVGTTRSQDKPMNVAERIAQVKETASRLLAADPKRLTVEQRRVLAADLLNLRVAVCEEFTGPAKAEVVAPIIAQLADALKAVESTDSSTVSGFTAAPVGQTDGAGIPGNCWDMLNRAVAGSGANREKAVEGVKGIADLIAANIGKLPKIQAAVESAVADATAGTAAKDGEVALPESVRTALSSARDELIKLTERDEASSAIVAEMTSRLASAIQEKESLVSENAELKAAAVKSAEMIAALTSAKNAGKVAESASAAPARKPLHERLAPAQPKTEGDDALPKPGSVVESHVDAGHASQKPAIRESATRSKAGLAAVALTKLHLGA